MSDHACNNKTLYLIENLANTLGHDLVFTRHDLFRIHELDANVLGEAYVSMLQSAVTSFLSSRWSLAKRTTVMLLNVTWEHLNTGHWKDVDVTWRHTYYLVSYMKSVAEFAVACSSGSADVFPNEAQWREAIRSCDMGLLMGAPILDGILSRLATKLQQLSLVISSDRDSSPYPQVKRAKLTASSFLPHVPSIDVDHAIVSCVSPSIELFRDRFMTGSVPVVLRDVMGHWPAMNERRWTIDYIRRIAGSRLVPVEIGSTYTDDSWTQTMLTIDEFIDQYIERHQCPITTDSPVHASPVTTASHSSLTISSTVSKEPVGYLAQHQLFDQIPELRKDIIVPDYCALGEAADEDVHINAWFGPTGTISPLHQDEKHNFLAQVVGAKYIRLYGVENSELVYPHAGHMLANTSRVDVENVNHVEFPLFSTAPYTECILREGEVLYIPPLCWHYVRSLSVSFSVSFWWR